MAATARILDFLRDQRPEGPCLVVDLEVIADNFRVFDRRYRLSKLQKISLLMQERFFG